jgi:hypothetical protein
MEFLCECADLECTETLKLSVGKYEHIRSSSVRFPIAISHDFPEVENVVDENRALCRRPEAWRSGRGGGFRAPSSRRRREALPSANTFPNILCSCAPANASELRIVEQMRVDRRHDVHTRATSCCETAISGTPWASPTLAAVCRSP